MRSPKQIEASRLNGAKSKGPKTEEGKKVSSQNSVRHGFSDGHCLLYFNERDELYQEHLASYTARFAPADPVESALVLRMVHADWRSRRADYMEAAMVDFQMDRMLPELKAQLNTWDQGTRIALGFQKSADNSNALALLVRYRAAADRAYDRALASLRLLQRDRRRAEEKNLQKCAHEPEEIAPGSTPTETKVVAIDAHTATAPIEQAAPEPKSQNAPAHPQPEPALSPLAQILTPPAPDSPPIADLDPFEAGDPPSKTKT